MRASGVDPRYWHEIDTEPNYRVDFWRVSDGASDEWFIEQAEDIVEVQAWAEERVGDRIYVIYAVCASAPDPGDRGTLVRLLGREPAGY